MYQATVIKDSINKGARITTMEVIMPRFILAQMNTHRVFSRNTASSRAVPVERNIAAVLENPVMPFEFGVNKAGMVAEERLDGQALERAQEIWLEARNDVVAAAQALCELGVHKQVVNRLLEPFNWTKTLITSTEWDNFFSLRLAYDAQPEMQHVARLMKEAIDASTPKLRDFHVPYVDDETLEGKGFFHSARLSAARCARISYMPRDAALDEEKDTARAKKLWQDKHLSPFEHQAIFIGNDAQSGNFRNWAQFRHVFQEDRAE